MLGGNVVDKLHDDNRFADARAAEQTDFSAFGIRADQVNDFDACFKDFGGRGKLRICGRRAVNSPMCTVLRGWFFVHGVAENIKNPSECFPADGNADCSSGVGNGFAALEAVGGFHRNAANGVAADMLSNFNRQRFIADRNSECIVYCGQPPVGKVNVNDRADNLGDSSCKFFCHFINSFRKRSGRVL